MKNFDLTYGSIPKLIKNIAVPASVGFLFHTLFNVTDTFFAGLLSTTALSALSISFPVFFVIVAIGSGIGMGTTALIGNAFGEKNHSRGANYASQAISFAAIVGILITVLGLVVAPFLFRVLGAEGEYLDLALNYMNVLFLASIFFTLVSSLNGILNSVGDTKSFRNVLIVGFFLNFLLSPAFMFGWLFLPKMGLAGVALGTLIIEFIGVAYLFYKVLKIDFVRQGFRQNLKPRLEFYKDIAVQGFPASLSMMTIAIGVFVITYFISQYGPQAVAAYGIATRIEQIALLPMIGLNVAVLSLVSQNKGARLYDRIRETVKKSFIYGIYIMTVGLLAVFALAPQLMDLFTDDAIVIGFGVSYLRIAAFAFYAYVIHFMADAVWRGYKKPLVPLIMGLGRQIVIPLTMFYAVVFIFKIDIVGLWWSIFGIVWGFAFLYLFLTKRLLQKDVL